jgi:hypothetical protein
MSQHIKAQELLDDVLDGEFVSEAGALILRNGDQMAFNLTQLTEIVNAVLARRPDSGKVAGGWIDASERLPEPRIRVLGASADGYVREVFYGGQSSAVGDGTKCWRENSQSFTEPPVKDAITHWMELPDAPAADSAATEQAASTDDDGYESFDEWCRDEVGAEPRNMPFIARAAWNAAKRSDSAAEPVAEAAKAYLDCVNENAEVTLDFATAEAHTKYDRARSRLQKALAAAPASADVGEPIAWLNPKETFACDAFLWKRDPQNPAYSVPVYRAALQASSAAHKEEQTNLILVQGQASLRGAWFDIPANTIEFYRQSGYTVRELYAKEKVK